LQNSNDRQTLGGMNVNKKPAARDTRGRRGGKNRKENVPGEPAIKKFKRKRVKTRNHGA